MYTALVLAALVVFFLCAAGVGVAAGSLLDFDTAPFAPVWTEAAGATANRILRLCTADAAHFAVYGTLLGAVRHGGVIPWDDDMDIAVPAANIAALRQHVEAHGLRMIKFHRFYKVFDPALPRVHMQRFSWPFVDVFPYTSDGAVVAITDIGRKTMRVPEAHVLPTHRAPWGRSSSIPVPAQAARVLDATFGPTWSTTEVSSSMNHRTTQLIVRRQRRAS